MGLSARTASFPFESAEHLGYFFTESEANMKLTMKSPVSDAKLGEFILDCMRIQARRCSECGRVMTQDECLILDEQEIKIPKEDLLCFIGKNNCQDRLVWEKDRKSVV